ncbi:restriction endonuclease subunit S [Aliarcobacter butzleri]|uniref:restriction endonuclease subunit S n=1 Tax=Aliarcobacter butzleri TaxID=28197 RepID=UPI001EDFD659|nr:restriction endonuclease subunit S [Aliarcobacter butzleri]MCG3674113.1 restriction endonuclease subunit S [Aliarcobacter butzleri]
MSNVPKLRFKEFSGEWKLKKLEQLSSKISDGIHSTPEYNQDGDYYFINGNNLKNGKIILDENTKKVTEKEYLKHYRELSNQTILMSINGTIGNIAFYNNENIMLGKSACYININNNLTNKFFISNQLSSSKIQYYYTSELTGSTIKNLSLKTIKNTPIGLPSIQEQEKIASFLTSVNTRIEQFTKKEALLQQYKKGVMQKIFNQEIRFKADDGSEFCEWKEKKLDEVANRYDNLRIPVSSSNRISGDTPYYGANGIQDYVEGFTHDGEFVLLAEDGANDLQNYPVRYVNGKIWVNNHAHVLQGKKNILNNKFFGYAISKINIEPFLVGGGRAKLNANILMKININIPSIQEQTKIANFLSLIDSKIEQVQKQLNYIKEFKKALLQQMFV